MRRWAWAIVLGVTLAVWAPAVTYDWNYLWDDAALFAGNPMVRQWPWTQESWTWIATTRHYGHWMPMTWLSAGVTHALFGDQAGAWHAINVALHATSAVLLYAIARRLTSSTFAAVIAALFFSIHPMRTESVAWIAERKDALMGVSFLGAALLWLHGRRAWAFVAFTAACLSKSIAVVLPVMLLALDWYRYRGCGWRLRWHATRPLLPFVAVSGVVSTVAFQSLHTIPISVPLTSVPLMPRLLHVAYSYLFYARQTLWPSRLSALIEYTWVPSWDQAEYPIAVALLAFVSVGLWLTRHRWPALMAAWSAYAVAVFPQAGLFQNGPQLVANRYSYLACLPFALLAAGAVSWGRQRWPRTTVAASVTAIVALIVLTEAALPMWENSDAMWQYAALHEPDCTQCQDMAAASDLRRGDLKSALRHQERAIVVSDTTAYPRWERHWNLAAILVALGERRRAIAELHTYLASVPESRREMLADRQHILQARVALAGLEQEIRR